MLQQKITHPTIFTIFGATGDLVRKKLFPALLDILNRDILPDNFKIVAFSRRNWDSEKFREYTRELIAAKSHKHSPEVVEEFLQKLIYVQGNFDSEADFQRLATKLDEMSNDLGGCVSRMFYFAVPPNFYKLIAGHLAQSGAASTCSDKEGWSRILIEKPFGRSAEEAVDLEKYLNNLFTPEQIFLIDHYLAKETIQNIILFRFSNSIFEPLWNSNYIDKVAIELHEAVGLEGRVTFYDGVGALLDMGQSHMLQLLALVAMEKPAELHTAAVRQEREQVLDDIEFDNKIPIVRAQYQSYTAEEGIDQNSQTETFFRIGARINNKRWRGTNFILESGKKLKQKKSAITVYFKPVVDPLCTGEDQCHLQNILLFKIQPDEGIEINFYARKIGFGLEMEERKLSFMYADDVNKTDVPDSYEYILYRAMLGDQMLFRSPDEEHNSWKFINQVMPEFKKSTLKIYPDSSSAEDI